MSIVHRYEIEVEESRAPQSCLRTVDITSRTGSMVRFQTNAIKALVAELDHVEDQREDCVFPFLSCLFQEFYAHQAPFRAAVRCLAELDVLVSLAAVSKSFAGRSCRAELVEPA